MSSYKMPKWLGLSKSEETIFAEQRSGLSYEDDIWLKKFLDVLKDYEAKCFIYNIAQASSKEEAATDDGQKEAIAGKNQGASVLRRIVRITQELGPTEAREYCLSGRLIIDNSLQQQVFNGWREGTARFKERFLEPFGIDSLEDLVKKTANMTKDTTTKVLSEIDGVTNKLEAYVQSRKNRPWWKKIFWA